MTDETLETDDQGLNKSIDREQASDVNATEPFVEAERVLEPPKENLETSTEAEAVELGSSAGSPNDPADTIHVAEVVSASSSQNSETNQIVHTVPPIPKQFQNLAANGGAVTALALGAFAMIGACFSDISAFNALLGLCFGAWGARSNLKRLNAIGMTFCIVALLICLGT